MIEGRSSMETIDAESCLENCILLFDCSDKEEIDNLKKILSKRIESCEGIVSNKQSVYIILFDNIYCRMEETLFFQEKNNLYFIDDLQELTEIIEKITDTDDDSKKASDNLTRREREILVLITKGKLNKEIANELNITERTVKNHIANLFKKINVYDRTQAAVYAIKCGIYSLYLEDL